jgi:hypothetical protein
MSDHPDREVPRLRARDLLTTEQRVRAGTADLARTAARRQDPSVTPADILPTTARLWSDDSLGPAADGRSRFVLVQPNAVRDGFRGGRTPAPG